MKNTPSVPFWRKYLRVCAYSTYGLVLAFSLGYIIFFGVVLSDWKLNLPYEPSRKWLDINSHSLLPPFFALPGAPLLLWQLRKDYETSDGDFYCILGTMLGLGAISIFSASKSMHYYLDRGTCETERKHLLNAMQAGVSRIMFADWQYTLEVVGANGERTEVVYENGGDGKMIENATGGKAFLADPDMRTLPGGGTWTEPYMADGGVRLWTHLIQLDFQCCGSSSYKDWDSFQGEIYYDGQVNTSVAKFGNYPPSCYCDFKCPMSEILPERCYRKCGHVGTPKNTAILKKRPGCCKGFLEYIHNLYMAGFVLAVIMGLLYFFSMVVYVLQFAALQAKQLEEEGFKKPQPEDEIILEVNETDAAARKHRKSTKSGARRKSSGRLPKTSSETQRQSLLKPTVAKTSLPPPNKFKLSWLKADKKKSSDPKGKPAAPK